MAYIPPHKRHTKGSSSSPKPEPLLLHDAFKKKLSFGESKRKEKDFAGIAYAYGATSKWFFVGFAERSLFSSLVRLQPFLVDSNFELESKKPLSLVLHEGCSERMDDKPWLWVAENVKQDLLLLFQCLKCEMEEVKPDVVARFGKILFYGRSSICQESLESNPLLDEFTLRQQMRRILYTNIPLTYMDFIENQVVEKLGLEYEQEKEIYLVKLVDKLLPDSIVFCKCIVAKDRNKIQLYKIELNPVRRMVADVSCLGKTLDLRLIICTRKIMKGFDEEINGIKHLIDSAIMDPGVKGGLRWPFGTDASGGRYTVIDVHYTVTRSYRNSLIRFKLRHADRFDFKSSNGEVTREIFVKMPGIVSELRKQTTDENLLFKMVEENLKLIWDHCILDDCSS